MKRRDVQAAREYALMRLTRDLPVAYVYHTATHTREVEEAAARLAQAEGISEENAALLGIAALYHDLGMVEQYDGHERASVRIAAAVLPSLGFSPADVQTIASMILATRLPQSPHSVPEQILADADLDILGRADFLGRNRDLRLEVEATGGPMTDEQWYNGQLDFLRAHRYWTAAARNLRDAGKKQNMQFVAELLRQK